ncbi:MAG: NUDIX hydrolase [Clostridia bacterium]|nr:NUDIX hydrolase [Clostridia bacterium]
METKTNWNHSTAAVCMKDGKVLLARHTYGGGKGKLIIPGGYLQENETPEDAVKREFLEEVGLEIRPLDIIGIRCNTKDWYIVFRAEPVSGEAKPDYDEIDEVLWLDTAEALERDDVPFLTKAMIRAAVSGKPGLPSVYYEGRFAPHALYSVE